MRVCKVIPISTAEFVLKIIRFYKGSESSQNSPSSVHKCKPVRQTIDKFLQNTFIDMPSLPREKAE